MLDVVNAHAEGVVADEEAADHGAGLVVEHGQFRPKEAVEQVMRAVVQSAVEFVHIHVTQHMQHVGVVALHSGEHGFEGHGQFHERGVGGFAGEDEVQQASDVLHTKFEITLFGLVEGEFVDAIRQPVVAVLPVVGFQEIFKRFFHDLEPARVAGQSIQAHKAEGGFAVVIDDAEGLLERQVVAVEHVHKLAGARVLHVCNAQGQLVHEGTVAGVAGELLVFDEGQQAHGVGAELEFAVVFCHKRKDGSVRLGVVANEVFGQIAQGALDGSKQVVVLQQLPAFEHGVDGAGVAQGVVTGHKAAKAGEVAVDELAVGLHLALQKAGAAIDQAKRFVRPQVAQAAAPCVQAFGCVPAGVCALRAGQPGGRFVPGRQCLHGNVSAEEGTFVGKHPNRRGFGKGGHGLAAKAALHMSGEVFGVDAGFAAVRAGVEHGQGVDFWLEDGLLEFSVERNAVAEVAALGAFQALLQLAHGGGLHVGGPVHPQPAHGQFVAVGQLLRGLGGGLPGGFKRLAHASGCVRAL